MAERFNAPVLKTGDPQGSVGSNPTPSATLNGHLSLAGARFGSLIAISVNVEPSLVAEISPLTWAISPRSPLRQQSAIGPGSLWPYARPDPEFRAANLNPSGSNRCDRTRRS